MPPPLAQETLDLYATALKFDKKPDNRETFMELAAAAHGRIPADVFEKQNASQQLPRVYRRIRGEHDRYSNWVTALDLQGWADSEHARITLPHLIGRLVWATGQEIVRNEFPTGRTGWDGQVETRKLDAFVPEGTSGWELGCGTTSRRKPKRISKAARRTPADSTNPRRRSFL